ncbi:hypothetical protein CJ030_MR3G014731 [Morella rubra]|uniref:DC1 domain-containing protein n=1 Tax=Morella rubra TaxID=262757 RepID=A0A6A1VY24_9ROSI|nr:hypothetical protein CJ030_MR3G014731 [Morella rubra]
MAAGIKEIQHPSHKHKLILTCAQSPFDCCGSKEIGFGSCYQCRKNKCNFHLHEECACAETNSTSLRHRFFSGRDFTFEDCSPENPLAFCVACGTNVQGFRYQSANEKQLLVLHPRCIKLPENASSFPEVVNQLGESLVLHREAPSKCLKDSIVENWKKDYLQQQNNGKKDSSSNTASSLSMVIQHKALTRRNAGTEADFSAIAKLVLQFVVSALLGNFVPSGTVDLIVNFSNAMQFCGCC